MGKKKGVRKGASVRFEEKSLGDLKPAVYNPRTISEGAMAGLEASISRFGLVQCPVWNERSGTLVGGHQRLKVLEKQGILRTTVAVVDLDPVEEKALNLTLNNQHIAGEFDERLADLLGIIQAENEKLFEELKLDTLLQLGSGEIPELNDEIDEEGMAKTENECPKCGFKW